MSFLNIQSTVLIDLQFVCGNYKQQYVKELVILFADSSNPIHHHFKPPYPENQLSPKYVKQNIFIRKYINGLDWSSGDMDYSMLAYILQTLENYTVVVKGPEKAAFLSQFLAANHIIDIQTNRSLSNMVDRYHNCPIHHRGYTRCGVNNVFKIMFFMVSNKMFLQQ